MIVIKRGLVLSLNFTITIVLFYYANLTKEIDIKIKNTELQIKSFKEKININEIEYAAHLNPEYLKKLAEIYFDLSFQEKNIQKIYTIKEFNAKDLDQIIRIKVE